MANYNPYFPAGYNPYQPAMQQFQTMQQPQQQNSGGLLWVQGIEGAKSHFVSPGQSVLLMDSESNSFFIKSADTSGMPLPLRIFDYQERTAQQAPQQPTAAVHDTSSYITREEFESRLAAITAIAERTEDNVE
jgi:hypothetical protein